MTKKQTAGRDRLGSLAPKFAELNDDVLFGQVWSREEQLAPRDRSMITCASLMSQGLFPQLESHLNLARANGVTQAELVEVFTQLAFYAGWPKAWSAFGLLQKVFGDSDDAPDPAAQPAHGPFPLGVPADGENFTGHVWLSMLTDAGNPTSVGNVTFAPGCVNRWHSHPQGQVLLVTAGRGWEQQDGQPARRLAPGDVVVCPPGVRHWHGAARDASLTHLAITALAPGQPTAEWLEFPDADEYASLG